MGKQSDLKETMNWFDFSEHIRGLSTNSSNVVHNTQYGLQTQKV